MKKFIAFVVIGFIVIYAIVTISKGNSSHNNVNGTYISSQQVTTNQPFNANSQTLPITSTGKSSAYYATLVNQYKFKVEQDNQHVDFCQNNYNQAIADGAGYITAQMTLNSAQQLLSTDEQLLEKYESDYNQAVAEGH